MPSWRFVLTDNSYEPVGEIINASDRKVAVPLSKLDTCSFKVRLDNPLADPLLTTAGYIKAYRDGVLRFYGPIVSAEETVSSDDASVSVNAVGAGWVLQKRLVAKPVIAGQPTLIVPTDRAKIFQYWLGVSDNESNIPIAWDAANSAASTSSYDPGINAYKPLYDVLTDLATGAAGFDWRVVPSDNFYNGAVSSSDIGVFTARPTIGSMKDDAVFEFGMGRNNLQGYTRTVTRDTQANKVFHIASQGGTSTTYPPISALDYGSIADFGLLEDLAQADLLDTSMRTALVQEHVAVRARPRQILQMTPHIDPQNVGRVPNYGEDYDVGDFVPVRTAYNRVLRLDTIVRIWGVSFDIDSNGMERTSTVLAEE